MDDEFGTLVSLAAADEALKQLDREQTRLKTRQREGEERCARADEELDALRVARDARLAEIADLERRLAQSRKLRASADRALRGVTPDAAAAVRQLDQAVADIDALETRILELMEAAEADAAAVDAAARATADAREQADAAILASLPDLRRMEAEEAVQRARREALLAELPLETRKRYAAVAQRRGSAFTRLVAGSCVSCQTFLGPQRELELARRHVLQCPRCNRWIVPSGSTTG